MRRIALAAAALVITAPLPALALTSSSHPDARVQTLLSDQLAAASVTDVLPVFVHGTDLASAKSAVAKTGMRLVTTWDKIGVAVAMGTPAQVRAAGTQPGVTYLEGNQELGYNLATSNTATRGEQARQTLTGADGNPLDGSGVGVAVIDSGVDGTHPFFQLPDGTSSVVRNMKDVCPLLNTGEGGAVTPDDCFYDVPGNDSDTPSAGGHGTHVAGIVGGQDVDTASPRQEHLHGAAPGARIVSLSVGASVSVYGGDAGLNWVLEHHEQPCGPDVPATVCPPIKVTNNSYGPPGGGTFDPEDASSKLQRALVNEGVVTVWAAGNDGGDGSGADQNTNPPGQDPTPGILMVASYNDGDTGTRDGSLSTFSSRGVKGDTDTYPDISAPGDGITSSCRIYLSVCSEGLDPVDGGDYNTISGTSMATPHIVGIVAQLFQANPALTPADVENVLEDTAHKYGDASSYETDPLNSDSTTSYDKGHGLVDVMAAATQVLGVGDPGTTAAACSSDAAFTDASGDATRVVTGTPLPSDPALDVVGSALSSDSSSYDTTFTISLEDLTAPTAYGQYFEYGFSYGGANYYLSAVRAIDGTTAFALGDFGGTSGLRRELATLTGTFDDDADEVRIVLPAATATPALTAGTVISGLEITSRRQFDAQVISFIPDADSAAGACPYTVGGTGSTPTPTTTPSSSSTPSPTGTPTPTATPTPTCKGKSGDKGKGKHCTS